MLTFCVLWERNPFVSVLMIAMTFCGLENVSHMNQTAAELWLPCRVLVRKQISRKSFSLYCRPSANLWTFQFQHSRRFLALFNTYRCRRNKKLIILSETSRLLQKIWHVRHTKSAWYLLLLLHPLARDRPDAENARMTKTIQGWPSKDRFALVFQISFTELPPRFLQANTCIFDFWFVEVKSPMAT